MVILVVWAVTPFNFDLASVLSKVLCESYGLGLTAASPGIDQNSRPNWYKPHLGFSVAVSERPCLWSGAGIVCNSAALLRGGSSGTKQKRVSILQIIRCFGFESSEARNVCFCEKLAKLTEAIRRKLCDWLLPSWFSTVLVWYREVLLCCLLTVKCAS